MRKDWFEDDNEIRLLHRGKRRLLDIVFGRTMVITLLLVLQIAIMVLGAHYLGRYYPALTIVMLFTPAPVADIASSTVREVLSFGRTVEEFLPEGIEIEKYL